MARGKVSPLGSAKAQLASRNRKRQRARFMHGS
jgi:hypothetical protein